MLEQGLNQLLSADPGVSALVGQCVYPVIIPENATYPCVSYQVISATAEYTLGSAVEVTKRVQFDAWSQAYADTKFVQTALHNLLDGFNGSLPDGTVVKGAFRDVEIDFFEQYSRTYRAVSEYVFHYFES